VSLARHINPLVQDFVCNEHEILSASAPVKPCSFICTGLLSTRTSNRHSGRETLCFGPGMFPCHSATEID
jgi:hypothetical protein